MVLNIFIERELTKYHWEITNHPREISNTVISNVKKISNDAVINGNTRFCTELERPYLTLSWRRPLSYRNQSIDLRSKPMDWFLYDNGLRHERVNSVDIFRRWPKLNFGPTRGQVKIRHFSERIDVRREYFHFLYKSLRIIS